MNLRSTIYHSPVGALHIIVDEQTVIALNLRSFSDAVHSLSFADAQRPIDKVKKIPGITDSLDDYFDGGLTSLQSLSVRQSGAVFSQKTWKAMRKIKPGKVATYSDLALSAGSPAAVRAAGTACGKNKIAIIIPCHRIIKSDGTLGNYGYGQEIKRKLLLHEGIEF